MSGMFSRSLKVGMMTSTVPRGDSVVVSLSVVVSVSSTAAFFLVEPFGLDRWGSVYWGTANAMKHPRGLTDLPLCQPRHGAMQPTRRVHRTAPPRPRELLQSLHRTAWQV